MCLNSASHSQDKVVEKQDVHIHLKLKFLRSISECIITMYALADLN